MKKILFYTCLVFGLISNMIINVDGTSDSEIRDDQLDIVFLNVPHGEATLLTNEKKENILVNTASTKSKKTLVKQLSKLDVDTIDTIILTNQEEEYTGNLHYFIEHYNVKEVILPNQFNQKTDIETTVKRWRVDEKFHIWKYVSLQAIDESKEGNISFLMRYRDESVMFLNNKNTKIENNILQNTEEIDILKIAEFGSGHSPSESFLQQSDPSMSIIFQSEKHPINEALIERLHETWIDIYFLKQSGSVFVRLSKDDYEILTGNYPVST